MKNLLFFEDTFHDLMNEQHNYHIFLKFTSKKNNCNTHQIQKFLIEFLENLSTYLCFPFDIENKNLCFFENDLKKPKIFRRFILKITKRFFIFVLEFSKIVN